MNSNNINKKYKSRNSINSRKSNIKSKAKLKKKAVVNKSIKNLHIMIDNFYSKRFIEFINKHFDKNKHLFVLRKAKALKYIDPNNYPNVKQLGLDQIKSLCDLSKKVFIHFLKDDFVKIVDWCKPSNKFYWIVWGADLYNYIDIDLFDKETKEFIIQKNLINTKKLLNKNKNSGKKSKQRTKAIRKMSYILATAKGDYNLIKANYNTKAKFIPFIYPNPIDFSIYDKKNENIINNNDYDFKKDYKYVILLGNSGYETNNHLDVLYKLKNIDSKEFCVIVPLSYGRRQYIDELILKGKELLGDQFIPLKSFLNPEEYLSILNQVDIGIMNHKRQQAIGTINLLLYLGKKVYINKKITYYSYLREIRIKVFSVDEINTSSLDEMVNFSDDYKKANKKAIKEFFSDNKAKEYMSKIFE